MTEQDYNNCVDEHSNGVYRFIVKNIRSTQDAEDIVQSAFEKLWVNRERVTPHKAKSYLYTVAYHQMIDVIRKENKKPTTNLRPWMNLNTGSSSYPVGVNAC